jgi:hypothetical protein
MNNLPAARKEECRFNTGVILDMCIWKPCQNLLCFFVRQEAPQHYGIHRRRLGKEEKHFPKRMFLMRRCRLHFQLSFQHIFSPLRVSSDWRRIHVPHTVKSVLPRWFFVKHFLVLTYLATFALVCYNSDWASWLGWQAAKGWNSLFPCHPSSSQSS